LLTLVTDDGYDNHAPEQCDAGISECDALIAQTGTVLVTSQTAGGRAMSCLPPHPRHGAARSQLPVLGSTFRFVSGGCRAKRATKMTSKTTLTEEVAVMHLLCKLAL